MLNEAFHFVLGDCIYKIILWFFFVVIFWLLIIGAQKLNPKLKIVNYNVTKREAFRQFLVTTLSYFGISVVFLFVYFLKERGYIVYYHATSFSDSLKYGTVYFCVLFVIQDFYFYFAHRLFHTPFFFRNFHYVHHQIRNVGLFSAFCFHPVERFVDALLVLGIVVAAPIHIVAISIWSITIGITAFYGHCGYELLDNSILKKLKIYKVMSFALYHNLHHSNYLNNNFGFYTTIPDKLFKTFHPDSEAILLGIKEHPPVHIVRENDNFYGQKTIDTLYKFLKIVLPIQFIQVKLNSMKMFKKKANVFYETITTKEI